MTFQKKSAQAPLEINFAPSVKQYEAWQFLTDKTTSELGYGGGAGSGKSYLGCFWQMSQRLAYPGTSGLIGRRELMNLKRTTLLTFFKVCAEFGLKEGTHFTYNQQDSRINFANKSTIFLLDLSAQPSDPLYTRLGGLELTDAFIDESNEVPIEAISILKTRIGRGLNDRYGLKPKLLETFNPSKEHIYHRYYKPWKTGTLPPNRKFVRALPTDNPHIPQAYLDQLAEADKTTKERLLYGNFEYDDDPTALIQYDALIDLWTNPAPENQLRYIVADIARYGSDRSVITLWNGFELSDVHIVKKQPTDVTAAIIRDLAFSNHVPYSNILVDSDGIGGGTLDQLKGAKGFIANSSPIPQGKEKDKGNYQNLKAQCCYLLADLVNNRTMAISSSLSISGETPTTFKELLIQDLEQVKTRDADKDGKLKVMAKDEVKERIGRSPDFGDCFMMRAYFELLPRKNSEYATTFAPSSRPSFGQAIAKVFRPS